MPVPPETPPVNKPVTILVNIFRGPLYFLPAIITRVVIKIKIPIIGIGAGSNLDGQILVSHDMLGMNKDFSPRFLRRYLDLDTLISNAVKKYSKDIKSGNFPNNKEQY